MIVDVDKESVATISVFTDGGHGEYESILLAREGALFVNALGDTELTDCKSNYYCNGWGKDILLFGDSYFSCWDSERWTSYLCESNGNNYLLNDYSGRKSDKALESLKHMLLYGRPDEIIWCMGMNDGDGEKEINSSWLSSVEAVIDICEIYEIELVLTTIPNCPTINNSYK